jgi:glycolate oxidase iron-sulfur subunit
MSSSLTSALASEQDKLLACVHCGLCLEACPTYVATGDENDSPRGRIYLMRAVEEGRLPRTSSSFQQHIDRCLGCRACESACPAGVEYGLLLEAARHEILKRPRGVAHWLMRFVLRNVWLKPARLRAAFAFARFIRDRGIASLLLRTGILRDTSPRLEFALDLLEGSQSNDPTNDETPEPAVKTSGEPDLTVMLFRGCVTDGLFTRVNEATARVLVANQVAVETPGAQVCCGALHAHAGDLVGARTLARQNIDAFGEDSSPIVTNAGGCGAMLASYGDVLEDDERYAARAREFSARVRDIGQQLEAIGFRNGAAIGLIRTTYDASCHLLHGQHGVDASLQMLFAIPDLNFALLKESEVCCGGAGVYNLLEPVLSEEILTAKIENIEASRAKILATGNPGCHMQIAAGARLAGIELEVYHPVEMLDESYRRAGFYLQNGDEHR